MTKTNSIIYVRIKIDIFGTDWDSLVSAKDWCIHVLPEKSDPVPDLSLPIHYCIESTSTYHQPVLLAFGGTPSIVNPTLAGASKRKTDVLDAQILATHDLVGVWHENYIPSLDISELRVLVWERDRCLMESTAASRRINNALVRFGYTLDRDGSAAKEEGVRDIVEAILDRETGLPENLCPIGIPYDVREVIISGYQKYDHLHELSEYWRSKVEEKSFPWNGKRVTLPCRVLKCFPF